MPDSYNSTAVIVLAAGEGSRMRQSGVPKQLLDIAGQPLIRRVAENALASACHPVVVVVGAHAAAIRQALSGCAVQIVENPRWQEGMGTSIQAGLSALPPAVDCAILTLGDQPLITASLLDQLIRLHADTGKPIVTAEYAGTVGVPVLFARQYFPALMSLEPDKGCKGVILKNRANAATMACPEAEADIDTPEDYTRLLQTLTNRP